MDIRRDFSQQQMQRALRGARGMQVGVYQEVGQLQLHLLRRQGGGPEEDASRTCLPLVTRIGLLGGSLRLLTSERLESWCRTASFTSRRRV